VVLFTLGCWSGAPACVCIYEGVLFRLLLLELPLPLCCFTLPVNRNSTFRFRLNCAQTTPRPTGQRRQTVRALLLLFKRTLYFRCFSLPTASES
jgi:hypothetical protein